MKYKDLDKTNFYQPTVTISNEFVPDIKLWRQPDYIDIPKIDKLVCPTTTKLFGDVSLEELIEMSTVSIVMENTLSEVIAYISLKTYPNIYSLDPAVWLDWMQFHYGLNDIKYENTNFVHLLVWDVRYNFEFLSHILRTIFLNNCKLEYICLLSLPGSPTSVYMGDQIFQQYFSKICPWGMDTTVHAQQLFVCARSEHIPKMKIRRAVVEDNDDLIEIVDKSCKKMREYYGDYYIAEIILNPNTYRTIVVAENENLVIGMLCLNAEINIKSLNQHYELEPFHGLKKHLPDEIIPVTSYDSFNESKTLNKHSTDDTLKNVSISVTDKAINAEQKNRSSSTSSQKSTSMSSMNKKESLSETLIKALLSSSSESMSDSSKSDSEYLKNLNLQANHHDSTITIKPQREYLSEVNAFAIELYGLRYEIDERLIYSLLTSAFETFINRDYCLIVLPTLTKTFPLLQHFVKVVPRPITTINHDLFVLHRNSIMSNISIRLIVDEDIEKLIIFYHKVLHNKYIIELIKETLITDQHVSFQSYVILNNRDIIGGFVLKDYHNFLYLKTNYDIDYHINYKDHKHCEIKLFYISPIFNINLFFIFNEIHRLTGYSSFYYFLYDDLINQQNLVTIISELIPIRPRRRIIYNKETILLDHVKTELSQSQSNDIFSLYHVNIRELNYVNKIIINARIVVIGMSTTSLSFLEELIYNKFGQKCTLANIILVTTNKYNCNISNKHLSKKLLPCYNKYNKIYLKKINLKAWINIIHGFLIKINRYKKIIIINNRYALKYDYLFLFCGLEFDIAHSVKLKTNFIIPSNIFIINNLSDGEAMYNKIKSNHADTNTIIVYGETLESYCCINFLLSIGVKSNRIIFVQPPLSKHKEFYVPVFNDKFVECKIAQTLNSLNIQTLCNYKLISWELNDNYDVKKINFETACYIKSIECSYCFIYDEKIVNVKTLKALNRAGLVFDGRLVIDSDCETNDPYIYAAGPLTKYRRILYADQYRHEYYNSEEIGKELGKAIVDKLNPTKPSMYKNPPKDFPLCVPRYQKPIVVSCRLPGKYNFLYIRGPGLPVPHIAAQILNDYGIDLVTGDPSIENQDIKINVEEDNTSFDSKANKGKKTLKYTQKECDEIGYFRLHLNQYNFVQTIVCLTKHKIDKGNIIELWGKHEKLLYNLLAHYNTNIIYDFYEYFRGQWAFALYHDRFNMLAELNNNLLYSSDDSENEDQYALLNSVKKCIIQNKWEQLSDDQRQEFIANYSSSKCQKLVETNLLNFLKAYADELPMYAHPDNIQNLLN